MKNINKMNKKYLWIAIPVFGILAFGIGNRYFSENKSENDSDKVVASFESSSSSASGSFLGKMKLALTNKSSEQNSIPPKAGTLHGLKKVEEFSFAKDGSRTGKNLSTIVWGLSHNFDSAEEHAKWAVENEKAFRDLEKNQNESVARVLKEYESFESKDKYNLHAKASLLIMLGRLGNESSFKKLSEIALKNENLPEGYKELQMRESILAMTALATHASKGNEQAKGEMKNIINNGSKVTRSIASMLEKK